VAFSEIANSPGWGGWVSFAWSLRQVVELPDATRRYPAIVANWIEALRIKALRQWADDNPIWLREYEGRWAADNALMVFRYLPHKDGQPWNQWDPPRRGTMGIAVLPKGRTDWLYVIAIDEGLADPFACNAFAFSPTDPTRTIYHVFGMEQGKRRGDEIDKRPESERAKMYARPVAQLLIGEALDPAKPAGLIGELGAWPIGIEGDCGESMILELTNVYGIRIVRFGKATNYKLTAIEVVNGDLSDGRIKILKGSALEVQLGELQYAEDDFGNLKENKAQANHSSDTLIIAREIIGRLLSAGTIDESSDPVSDRRVAAELARLKAIEDPPDPEDASHSPGFAGMLVGGDYSDPWSQI